MKMEPLKPHEEKLLEKCVFVARDAGCPRDQTEQFLSHGYVPFPWQWRFHAACRAADLQGGPVDIGLGGARGPGKSHAVLSQVGLDDCQRVAGLKWLFLRQTGMSAKESFEDLIGKTLRGRIAYENTAHSLKFKNGSRVVLGGFHDEGDIDKYIGIEYDGIVVEELNQLTGEKYQKLRGSLRTSKPNWRPRSYTSFNPGGIGHTFVRERYVLPMREHRESETRFVPSTYKENPALNQEYIQYLESLAGDLGRAWREGEWDSFFGQYFKQWSYERHVVEPFEIPTSWFRYRSIDPSGRDGVTSCHWYAVNSEGRVYVYREYYRTGRDHDEHARAIASMSTDRNGAQEAYRYTVIDAAAFSKAGFSETMAEIYSRNGVNGLMPSAKERVVGWNAVNAYLRHDSSTQPLLKIFSTCRDMIRTIPIAQHDEKHPDDVMSQRSAYTDIEGNQGHEHQDALDDLRYLLRTLREIKSPAPTNLIEKRVQALRALRSSQNYSYTR